MGPLNVLLWGSETWNLIKANLKKLNKFPHSAIRWILGIKWEKMKEERITNNEVRAEFNNIPPVKDFVGRHTLRFLERSSEQMIDRYRRKCSMHGYQHQGKAACHKKH